jgi:hypothetical protein
MRLCVLFFFLACSCLLLAQSADTKTETKVDKSALGDPAKAAQAEKPAERWLFPRHDWIYGYVEFDVAPPHNEPDPNLCSAKSGDFGGVNAPCNAFARWVMAGQVELRPFGGRYLRRLKFFAAPTFVFGKTVPQFLYTWSMAPIGWERQWGASIYLGYRTEMRVTQHFQFDQFGSYSGVPGYLGPNGPWGRSTTIGVRKYFGYPSVHDEGAH